ncbi:sensor histidine kinase [Pseudomonas sp. HK3]|jgi:signal transduction histidine kinase
MSDAYKVAYDREKLARLAAEKLLDEKTREVQSSIDMIQHQFNDLMAQKKEADYLLEIARLTQVDQGLSESVSDYTTKSMKFLNAKFSRYSFIKNGKISVSNVIGIDEALPALPINMYQEIYRKHDRSTVMLDDIDYQDMTKICEIYDVNRVILLPIKCFGKVSTVCELYLPEEIDFKPETLDQCQVAGYQVGGMLERNANNKKIEDSYLEIKSSHDKIKQAQAQLVQSEKMASLGQLAAGVAHEINNPIGFVSSNFGTLREYTDIIAEYFKLAETLAADSDSDVSKKMVEMDESEDFTFLFSDIKNIMNDCDDGLKRVKEIVLNLKSFARGDEETTEAFSLNNCIENTIKVVWNELKYKVTLHKEFDEANPIVNGHEGQIGQVIMNMLVNAAQAMEVEGHIYISTIKQDGFARLIIRDTAKGMPQSVVDKIFDPFYTTKGVNEGTGLGLSISHGIVEKHGGKISVESEEGVGTSFMIDIPLVSD